MKLKIIKLLFYSAIEIIFSACFIAAFEAGNDLGWFVSGFLLVLFNGAILSLEDDKTNIIYRG